jgi:hypothetical protein
MQEEPFNVIRTDASSRKAGALQDEAIVKLLLALNNAADGSLRLALWVKIDEINRLSSDKIMKKLLINFHTRFRE